MLKITVLLLVFTSLLGLSVHGAWSDEDEDSFGRITVVREPVPAVTIDEDFIPVGEAHTYSYRL